MNRWEEERARELEDEAAAIRAREERVTVELSLPLAWLIRDAIGVGPLKNYASGIGLTGDMDRLNEAIPGYRVENGPHVSRWSARIVRRMMENYRRR